MFFSQILNLPQGHSEVDFVDIDVHHDTELFIDPCLIEVGKSSFCQKANNVLQDCMDYMVDMYRSHASYSDKLRFFDHMHEVNCTKLGYGDGDNGKAKSAEGMIETLSDLEELIDHGIDISHAIDLPIFIKDYAEDCLSDTLTNNYLRNFVNLRCSNAGNTGYRLSLAEMCVIFGM